MADDTDAGNDTVTRVDVIGVCTSRDVFSMTGNGWGRYAVGKYVRLSPTAFCAGTGEAYEPLNVSYDDIDEEFDYLKRILTDELGRLYEDTLMNSGSDWAIVDIRTLSYEYYEVEYGSGTHYIMAPGTKKPVEEERVANAARINGYSLEGYRRIGFEDLPGVELRIKNMCDFLKRRYGRNIVLLDVKDSKWVLRRSGRIAKSKAEKSEYRNAITGKYFPMFERELGCRCIRVPDEIVSDEFHMWGYEPVHYVQEFYDYAVGCLDAITGGGDDAEIDGRIRALYEELCSRNAMILKGRYLSRRNSIRRAEVAWKMARGTARIDRALWMAVTFLDRTSDPILKAEMRGLIGKIWRDRKDGHEDLKRAVEWLKLASEGPCGYPEHELLMALWKMNTKGSLREMMSMARRLRRKGDPEGTAILAMAYLHGRGAPRKRSLGKRLLAKAASENVGWAAEKLELMKGNGRKPRPNAEDGYRD